MRASVAQGLVSLASDVGALAACRPGRDGQAQRAQDRVCGGITDRAREGGLRRAWGGSCSLRLWWPLPAVAEAHLAKMEAGCWPWP